MKISKKRIHFFIVTGIFAFIGGIVGFLSSKYNGLSIPFSKFSYNLFYKLGIVFFIVTILITTKNLIDIVKYSKSHDKNSEVARNIEKKLEFTMFTSTSFSILFLGWYGVLISFITTLNNIFHISTGIIIILTGAILQGIVFKYHNKLYPKKAIDPMSLNADKDRFDKLDEGEKWMIYKSSYKTFRVMDFIYSIVLTFIILASMLFSLSSLSIVIVTLLWISQKLIYFCEARKFNNE
ncbi:protein of unknown function DUF3169 [Gottschalkia purinilytica]|uniref:DUF3169 family protein n=1 Tax=Gottschalkia purinilytica TaxID=1503 RepID=A0A0L0WAD9_GOTPU|nr:DUF3169 family protein [Gottschalkia purinilytica]KNF08290.1 protein of unknown function DUF3169 [Gottschalkia purinilytica]